MLGNLKLTNFRRHRDIAVSFTDGIQALRGANEMGKSSLLESVSYALFGSKALRTPLEQAVTWGEDVKTLKVELEFISGGVVHSFKRGKSGAEVIKNGEVFVTGQNEVSSFAASLLGADLTSSNKLLFASQNGLRGALEEGPKALSQMIEDLAGFDAFDTILDAAQEKLSLGSPSLLEERLKGAMQTLATASESMPTKPDANAHALAVAEIEAEIEAHKASVPDFAAKATAANTALTDASTLYLKADALSTGVTRAQERVNLATATVAGHQANAGKVVPEVLPLQIELANAEAWDVASKAYAVFKSLPVGDRYEGTVDAFEAAIADVRKSLKEKERDLIDLDQAINAAHARRLNHTNCQTCGQDVTHLASVVETNAKVDADLVRLTPQKADVVEVVRVQQLKAQALEGYRSFERQLVPFSAKLSKYVTFDDTQYPSLILWSGCVPPIEGPDTKALKEALTKAEADVKAIEQAQTRLEMAQGQLNEATTELAKAQADLAGFAAPSTDDILDLTAARDSTALNLTVAEGNVIIKRQALSALKAEFTSAQTLWSSMHARVEDAEKVIANCQGDIENLGFNNALVKKLRNIRPAVADKLWNTILASVSVMFSQMRNEESWVTKGKDGFRVNAQSVESLSGSTLDLLGLAIRCALLKTFLPQCGLLILDEPAAAIDISRTEALVGFIAGAGFQQTLLVTHETVSSNIADNLIEL